MIWVIVNKTKTSIPQKGWKIVRLALQKV